MLICVWTPYDRVGQNVYACSHDRALHWYTSLSDLDIHSRPQDRGKSNYFCKLGLMTLSLRFDQNKRWCMPVDQTLHRVATKGREEIKGTTSRRWQDDITRKEGTTWNRKATDRGQ